MTKVCTKCKVEKELTDFHKSNRTKDGFYTSCVVCERYKDKRKRENRKNKNIITPPQKHCQKCNEEKESCEFSLNSTSFDGLQTYCKKCTVSDREYMNAYVKNRERADVVFRLRNKIRKITGLIINGKSRRSLEILGCSYDFFKSHIESQFLNWMSWENYGKLWDLDHIIPISSAKSEEELYLLNHWSNFQPLESKYNKWIKRDNIFPLTNLELNITINAKQK